MGTFSETVRNSVLDAIARNVSYAEAELWVKLHLGDPGSAGTANPALNTTRKQATFGSAATGGAIANTVALEWTNVPNTEDYTWISIWDASTGGNHVGNDDLSATASVTAGDTFRIPIGDLDLTFA